MFKEEKRHDYIFLQSTAIIWTNQNLIGKQEKSIRKTTIFSVAED